MTSRRESLARRKSAGFTLIEILVGTVLASIVLLGLFNFMTTMLSSEVNATRNGTVSAWALAGITAMNSDIAAAGAVGYPALGATADSLIVCTNWSMSGTPGQVVAAQPTDVYYYCWDTTDAAPNGNTLLRKVVKNNGTCPTVPPACTVAAYGGGAFLGDTVVATGVYRDTAGDPIFFHDNRTSNAVRLRYSIGNPTANSNSAGGNGGTVTVNPVTIPYNTEIILED